jgi:DNA-binding SARP family transcriptional activator
MFGDDLVVHTRFLPPRLPRRWLPRSRLDRLLATAAEYPVTVVSASAGYGKSSALASFAARGGWPTIWFSLSDGITDPLIFLIHLVHACRTVVPAVGERALARLEQHRSDSHAWTQALDMLIDDLACGLADETMLVLDDYQIVDDIPAIAALIERLMLHGPPLLHLLLASRGWPQLRCIPTLQARDELFVVGEQQLAFAMAEIAELAALLSEHELSPAQAQWLHEQTGGWPIAVPLMWQHIRQWASDSEATRDEDTVPLALGPLHTSPPNDVLFAYLAQETLAGQPEDIQAFLLRSSVLAELDPVACDYVLGGTGSGALLRTIERRGTFLTAIGDEGYRYHRLFQCFLQRRARETLPDWLALHQRAAAYYRTIDAHENVLYHYMAAGDSDRAALELEDVAPAWLASGRLTTLLHWLDQLPALALAAHPQLQIARGDAARLLARFETALHAYAEAEAIAAERADAIGQSRAIQGQALVYLDTVQPAQAIVLLRRAYKLLPTDQRAARAALLRLIAENWLNSGRASQAARLYRAADRLDQPGARSDAQPRVLLRLGRLAEARALLTQQLPSAQTGQRRPPEAHREATLLLSLICALQGDVDVARQYAEAGLDAARQQGSALSEAVAHMRLGHALQIGAMPDYLAASGHYLQAIALADAFGVQRTKAEAYMGLALLHGFSGDPTAAQQAAREGLAMVEPSGDRWMDALLRLVFGAVGVVNGLTEAEPWLQMALDRYQMSKDSYGQAVAHFWLAVRNHRAAYMDAAARHALQALTLAQRHGYDGLLTRPTLLGPRDRMTLVPVLLAGHDAHHLSAFAQTLLAQGFPGIAGDVMTETYHPGVTLRVQLFDRLRVWRGTDEIAPRAWHRKKAQQLLALLLTNRHQWLLRDQICESLWPDDSQADAETQFKVTLNALNGALEPARAPRISPFFIRRQGSAYRFCPPDGIWVDVAEFEALLESARTHLTAGTEADVAQAQQALTRAVRLYQGDYLSEYLYEDWAREERARLATRYLAAATTLAELHIKQNRAAETIRLCELILARDSCWEEAYQLLMRAYADQGNRSQVVASYDRCVRHLRAQLDMDPLPRTTEIFEAVKAGSSI